MTDTEIINRIIAKMSPEQHYRFLDLWIKESGESLQDIRWAKGQNRVFKTMTEKKLIRHIRSDGNDEIVELTARGIKVREAGGLKLDTNKILGRIGSFSKSFWVFLIGFFTIVPGAIFTYEKFLKNDKNELPTIQTEKDSLKIEKQQLHADTLNINSAKSQSADSLDND